MLSCGREERDAGGSKWTSETNKPQAAFPPCALWSLAELRFKWMEFSRSQVGFLLSLELPMDAVPQENEDKGVPFFQREKKSRDPGKQASGSLPVLFPLGHVPCPGTLPGGPCLPLSPACFLAPHSLYPSVFSVAGALSL